MARVQCARLTRSLLILTFVTGVVDAVCFVGLGGVFAAMQTGNVIFLGLGIGGAPGAALVGPLVALLAFVVGGVIAAASGSAVRRPAGAFALIGVVECALLAGAAGLATLLEIRPDHVSAYALIGMLALAMGFRNTIVRQLGSPNLATTVLNLTVTSLAAPAVLTVASGEDLAQRLAALVVIVLGAIAGALLVEHSIALPLAIAAALSLAALAAAPRSAILAT